MISDEEKANKLEMQQVPLTNKDKRKLRRDVFVVWGVALLMMSFFIYFFWFFGGISTSMRVPLLIFSVFFLGILAFIVFSHTRNAFQTEKTVYTGILEEKITEAARGKNSQMQEYYYFQVSGRRFGVSMNFFLRFHVGMKISVHCIRGNAVFSVTSDEKEPRQTTSNPSAFPDAGRIETMSESDRKTMFNAFLKALLFRGLLGGIGFRIIYSILLLAIIILSWGDSFLFQLYYYCAIILCVLSWTLLNRKTFRLFLDWQGKEIRVWEETILDKMESTHFKPGPQSIVTTRYQRNGENTYFYIQTERFWLRVDRSIFEAKKTGERIYVSGSPRQKLVLSVRD